VTHVTRVSINLENTEMSYDCQHFSIALPKGRGQNSIPNLLRHLANALEEEGSIEVMDIVFHNEETDDNAIDWPNFTVYFTESGPESPAP
jgi:hypothetical protein